MAVAAKCYYLVDFENVGVKGLEGAERLGAEDAVVLFSTKNAAKLPTATLAQLMHTQLDVREVTSARSQAVDMHLVSHLGFLLGGGGKARFVVVSNDADYDDVIGYWKARQGADIRRQATLGAASQPVKKPAEEKPEARKQAAQKPATAKPAEAKPVAKPAAKPAAAKPAAQKQPAEAKQATQKPAEAKPSLNDAVQRALAKVGYPQQVVGFAASLAATRQGEAQYKQAVYQALVAQYGRDEGLAIYNCIRKLL